MGGNRKAPTGFAAALKRLREAAGLSQLDLAKKAGMNQFGVAKLEQGQREPSWATVQSLAKALGLDCTAFSQVEEAPAGDAKPATKKPKGKK